MHSTAPVLVPALSAVEAAARLLALPAGWHIDGLVLTKDLAPRDFEGAIALVTTIAALADAADHHPDLSIGFGRLQVRLTTHDAGGLTARDFDLAASIEAAAPAPGAPAPTTPVATPALTVAALSAAARAALSTTVPAWRVEDGALVRAVAMPFLQAAALLNEVAALAIQQDHHPDIELAAGQLVLRSTTHDAGGLSDRDVVLAQALDRLLANVAG